MEYILRLDVGRREAKKEEVPEEYRLIGGRGLIAMILNREVDPLCDPLGALNKLVVAPGLLAGTLAPSFGRISVGCKSPLTKGIKEANAGGTAAQKLDRLGIKAIIVEGERRGNSLWMVRVSKEGVEFLPAEELAGRRNYEVASSLQGRFGENVAVISIGPAGEMGLAGATVAVTDLDGRPSRHAARGGVGAVMGAKGLKAMVIDDSAASRVEVKDGEAFRKTVQTLVDMLKADKGTPAMNSAQGTPSAIPFVNKVGSMPTRNYRAGSFELAERIYGETIKEVVSRRGGGMHGCMPGCIIRCSIVFPGEDGRHITSALEYETLALMGSNLGIGELDAIARLDRLCDELGLDTIEMGSALSQVMAAGRLSFGDAEGVMKSLEEVERGTPWGKIIGEGTIAVSKELGLHRVPAVLGQAIPAHDPRSCKAVGVTYATSAMGADHTAGIDYRDSLSREGQVRRSKQAQIAMAAIDSVGYCMLALPTRVPAMMPILADLINARYGSTLTEGDIRMIGMKTIQEELEFNRKAFGSSARLNPLPEFIKSEPLPPQNSVFDVPEREMEMIWSDFPAVIGPGPVFLKKSRVGHVPKGKAAVFAGARRPFFIREYELPEVEEKGALVKIAQANICGSDLHMWRGESPCPVGVSYGHEMTGRIVKLGAGLHTDAEGKPLKEGDRVVYPYFMSCGTCKQCVRGNRIACPNKFDLTFQNVAEVPPHFRGAFAEYYYSRPGLPLFKVPDSLSDEMVAAVNCALSQVLYGLTQASLRMGDSVVIQGAGGLGVYGAAVAKGMGAGRVIVIDKSSERLSLAKEFGADVTINFSEFKDSIRLANEVKRHLDGEGADVVLGVAGVPSALAEGLRLLSPGGIMIEIGNINYGQTVAIDPAYMVLRSLTLKTVAGYESWAVGASLRFLERNRDRLPLEKISSRKFPFEKINEVFGMADRGEIFRAALVFPD